MSFNNLKCNHGTDRYSHRSDASRPCHLQVQAICAMFGTRLTWQAIQLLMLQVHSHGDTIMHFRKDHPGPVVQLQLVAVIIQNKTGFRQLQVSMKAAAQHTSIEWVNTCSVSKTYPAAIAGSR